MTEFLIRPAVEADVPVILELIQALAEYERAPHEVVCDEARLRESLFGAKPDAEVLLACVGPATAGFAVFFTIIRRGGGGAGSIWRICSCVPRCGEKGSAKRC